MVIIWVFYGYHLGQSRNKLETGLEQCRNNAEKRRELGENINL